MRAFYEEMNEKTNTSFSDPMFERNNQRFVLFPIQYPEIWKMAKTQQANFWTAEELDLTDDLRDWQKLNDNEKSFVKSVLGFFAASDGIVNENIDINFSDEVTIPEARYFYTFQSMIESIHNESYSLLIDTYIKDEKEKQFLFNAMDNVPAIRRKCDWAMKWFDKSRPFKHRIVAFACVEGIQFSASFCAIFWLKKRGLMFGLAKANEFISRDEALHRDFSVLLHKTLKSENQANEAEIHEIVREAVEVEKLFVEDALKVNLIGMNSELMCQYVEFVADHLLTSLGVSKLYNVSNPFEWMDSLSLSGSGKTNFFEQRVSEYSKAGVMVNNEDNCFNLDADF